MNKNQWAALAPYTMSMEKSLDAQGQLQSLPLLQVRGLSKYFPIFSKGFLSKKIGDVRAVDNVSFDLFPGETLGIVGESGSGKTTTGRTILRAIEPTAGEVLFNCEDHIIDIAKVPHHQLKSLRTKMQMIFQDPFSSLNPRMTVGDIVSEPLVIHKMAKGSELEDRVAAILEKVGLKPEYKTRYPHAFSGGQRQRIGIARALIMNPLLVVADEAVSALDVSVQAQVINLMKDLQDELGLTYIFVAHDLSVVRHICDKVAVMYGGRIVELAPTEEIFTDPKHPYTQALLRSVPNPNPDIKMAFGLEGEVADPSKLPQGCAFHPRCRDCFAECSHIRPEILKLGASSRSVACLKYK